MRITMKTDKNDATTITYHPAPAKKRPAMRRWAGNDAKFAAALRDELLARLPGWTPCGTYDPARGANNFCLRDARGDLCWLMVRDARITLPGPQGPSEADEAFDAIADDYLDGLLARLGQISK